MTMDLSLIHIYAMRMMTTALYSLGFSAWPKASLKSVNQNKAVIMTEAGVEMEIACDAIVNAADMLPNTSLLEGCLLYTSRCV